MDSDHQQTAAITLLASDVKHLAQEVGKLSLKFDEMKADDNEKIDANAVLRTRVWFLEKVVYGIGILVATETFGLIGVGIAWIVGAVVKGGH